MGGEPRINVWSNILVLTVGSGRVEQSHRTNNSEFFKMGKMLYEIRDIRYEIRIRYCQAQLKLQLQLKLELRLALFSNNPATHPPRESLFHHLNLI